MRRNKRPSYLRVALGGLKNCYRAHPPLFFALMLVSALLCLIEVGELFSMRTLFDAVAAHAAGGIPLLDVISAAIPMAVLLLAAPLVRTPGIPGAGLLLAQGQRLPDGALPRPAQHNFRPSRLSARRPSTK